MKSKYTGTHSVCTRITQSRLDYRQRSDYRWLRLFRSMEQKQGPPFACLLFPCTQLELIVLHWKHKDRVECRLEDGLTKYKRSGLLERVGHVPFHPTSIRFRQLKFSVLSEREKTPKIYAASPLSVQHSGFSLVLAVIFARCAAPLNIPLCACAEFSCSWPMRTLYSRTAYAHQKSKFRSNNMPTWNFYVVVCLFLFAIDVV